jgi:hypothetical protein
MTYAPKVLRHFTARFEELRDQTGIHELVRVVA